MSVRGWADHRQAGGRTTLWRYHERYMQVIYSDCPSFTSVRGHILRCMGRDPVTGEKRR